MGSGLVMQTKTTRAFRTISEAGEELDLQPHVLRFWESKFSQIKPIKRGGGRRFYRPEDIELIRGIKILLHDEKHPIKDVQKLIRVKGVQQVVDLGRSREIASRDRELSDVGLVPERIQQAPPSKPKKRVVPFKPKVSAKPKSKSKPEPKPKIMSKPEIDPATNAEPDIDTEGLESALDRLKALRAKWDEL